MNFLAGASSALFGFACMMAMTTFVLGKDLPLALLYSCLGAAILFVAFGFMARNVRVEVKGTTIEAAAAVIAAKFKISRSILTDGSLRLDGGANFFWAPVIVTPADSGVVLFGPSNVVAFMKARLEKT